MQLLRKGFEYWKVWLYYIRETEVKMTGQIAKNEQQLWTSKVKLTCYSMEINLFSLDLIIYTNIIYTKFKYKCWILLWYSILTQSI